MAISSVISSASARIRPLFAVLCLGISSPGALGQVYEWEFVDPTNPALGKQASTTLAPDGATANFNSVLGLAGRDLTKAYLFGAELERFRVRTTVLDDAYLAEANLFNLQGDELVARGADMSRSNLQTARLERADLAGTSFAGANLSGAHLAHATLAGADFSAANIHAIDLRGTASRGFTSGQLYQTASYQRGALGAIDLSTNDMTGWHFTNQRMQNGRFFGADFTGAQFEDAVVDGAEFSVSNLSPTQLYATTSYKNRQLDDVQLDGMDLAGWGFTGQSLVRSRISNSELSGANFNQADLERAHIGGGQFTVQSDVTLRGANLSHARFDTNGRWERADFTGANLEGAILSHQGFANSIFTDAIIRGAELNSTFVFGFTLENLYSTASYKSGDLTGIEIQFGDLTGANFQGIDLSQSRLARITLREADFRGATLRGASIGATLDKADFRGADLTDANLSYDPVSFIDFRGADLTGARFERTSLANANFTGAIVFGAALSVENGPRDLTAGQLYSTASYQAKSLGPITLTGDMQGWDFREQDMTGARFGRNSQLERAHWAGANLQNAHFVVNTLGSADFRLANLRQASFTASNVDGGLFQGAELSGVRFVETSLVQAQFEGAHLADARFDRVALQNTNFANANLRGARFQSIDSFAGTEFTGADIIGADFSYATSAGFTEQQLRSTRSYQQRDLSGVSFEGILFSGINLAGFRLAGANFSRAELVGADLSRADLTGVSFLFANIENLDLTDAIVRRASFYRAEREGFDREMLESTASYKDRKLDGINLSYNDLSGWNFRAQDLREASFEFSDLVGTSFELADLRGALLPGNLAGVELMRTILPDGELATLRNEAGETLTIRAAPELIPAVPPNPRDPDPPRPVAPGVKVADREGRIDGSLELLLGDGEWESTIVFRPRVDVTINGVLRLGFDDFVDPAAMVGRSFDLFNWRGASIVGEFAVGTASNHVWDLSNLYSTGTVQLVAIVPEPSALAILAGMTLALGAKGRRWRMR